MAQYGLCSRENHHPNATPASAQSKATAAASHKFMACALQSQIFLPLIFLPFPFFEFYLLLSPNLLTAHEEISSLSSPRPSRLCGVLRFRVWLGLCRAAYPG